MLCFQNATRYGPIFVCSSCDQKMFQNNVTKLDEKLIENIKSVNSESYDTVIANNIQEITLNTKETGNDPEILISVYLCSTCKRHLLNGKLPPMSKMNGLDLVDLRNDPDLKLSELESNLISKRLLFQKIYQLPRSRMAGCKDRLINT